MPAFHSATVMLGVPHPPTSAKWWERAGFSIVMTDAESQDGETFNWAFLQRGEAALMLTMGEDGAARGAPMQLYFRVEDADAVLAEFKSTFEDELDVVHAIRDQHYGMRDFLIQSPECFELGFGSLIAPEG